MPLLDRVKDRIETDLSDLELQSMIDEVVAEIERRFGVNAATTVELDGGASVLTLSRPIDTGQPVTIVETDPANTGDAANETALSADDYRVRDGGRTLERLIDGTNGRSRWAPLVRIAYTPVSDARQREEVVIKIVHIDAQHRGVNSERAGDWQASYPDAAAEREKLINSLAPRGGLMMA